MRILFFCLLSVFSLSMIAQDDMLSMLGEEDDTKIVRASFKTNRVINLHSLENTAAGHLDFKISHRFGFISTGIDEFFGLDNSTIRIGLEYGMTDKLMIGVGRSSYEKTVDGFIKYKILQQKTGTHAFPFTLAYLGTGAIKTIPFANENRDNHFSSRVAYAHQLIIGRKMSPGFSFQLSPTLIHRNLVPNTNIKNDVYAIGAGTRIKLTNRTTFNVEYIYVLPDQIAEDYINSLSVGLDIETGGHVFQLHATNSTSMIEKGFVAETTGKWKKGDIHFGFNISRIFNVARK